MNSENKTFKTMSGEENRKYITNPYHKPAGTHKPQITYTPVRNLTPVERLHLMFNPKFK